MGPDLHEKESLCFVSANEQHDSTPLMSMTLIEAVLRSEKHHPNSSKADSPSR